MAGMHGTPEYCAPEVVIRYWHEQGQLAEPPPLYGLFSAEDKRLRSESALSQAQAHSDDYYYYYSDDAGLHC